jgi:DNA-binding transcriptional ArsR family regulator
LPRAAIGRRSIARQKIDAAWTTVRAGRLIRDTRQLVNRKVDYVTSGSILNRMVNNSSAALDLVFRALADPTRRRMLRSLASGERTVSELAEPFRMSLPAVSKHVRALEDAGLVRRTVRGRTHYCRLNPKPLSTAHEWLSFYERFWNERLDALEALLRHPERDQETE